MSQIEHAKVDPLVSEFFAFKVLPREFGSRGASSLGDGSDDETDAEADSAETCEAVGEKIVRRIRDQCKRSRFALEDDFVVNKDVVG